MELELLKQTMEAFRASGYREIRLATDEVTLELVRAGAEKSPAAEREGLPVRQRPQAVAAPRATEPVAEADKPAADAKGLIRAQMAGTFYVAPEPGAKAFVSVGSKVKKGDTLGLLEAMKMISEITAPFDGTVRKVFLENETFAEFDAPLFELEEMR